MKLGADGADYCIEAWIKPKQGNGFIFYSAGGTGYNGATNDEGIRIAVGANGNANDGTGTNYDWQIHSNEQVNNSDSHVYSGETLLKHACNHVMKEQNKYNTTQHHTIPCKILYYTTAHYNII